MGLGPIAVPGGYCEERLVLSDSVLGYLDEPRPMPPLQQLIGAVLPPMPEDASCRGPQVNGFGKRSAPRTFGVPGRLILHGSYSDEEMAVLVEACAHYNLSLTLVGERCLSITALKHFCDAYAPQVAGTAEMSAAIMFTSGDLSCVHLAGVCENIRGLIVRPILAEQLEVAIRASSSKIGIVLAQSDLEATEVRRALGLAISGSQEANLRHFGEALRVAGGTTRAALWISRALDYSFAHFLPVDCGLPWHQHFFLDVYALYLCGLLASLIVLKVVWEAFLVSLNSNERAATTATGLGFATYGEKSGVFSFDDPPFDFAAWDSDEPSREEDARASLQMEKSGSKKAHPTPLLTHENGRASHDHDKVATGAE
ncbi:Hypothetical Protein FCC1311_082812 [Hondaea fermentalgiana]|uniref:Uncharacterized protein n=1 Tax=Hondaea fermentalgiana TaxID=2315210 RepID=A0A2R5GME6_9STRA|nr:Hypothetical Protein FCC1311_082812 [Hondaea fermentalgiana]|eukprot:GBG32056.1 Hypothetical Protein FCC1311_082812 [Hondaea fermentalgiana]